jgi:hypothetical protein
MVTRKKKWIFAAGELVKFLDACKPDAKITFEVRGGCIDSPRFLKEAQYNPKSNIVTLIWGGGAQR